MSFIDPNNVLPLDSSSRAALDESDRLLREAITCSPGYASAYNNLAQVLRMKHDTDGTYGPWVHYIRCFQYCRLAITIFQWISLISYTSLHTSNVIYSYCTSVLYLQFTAFNESSYWYVTVLYKFTYVVKFTYGYWYILEFGTRYTKTSCFVFRVYRYKHDPIKYKHDTNTKKFVKFASKFLH